MVSQTPQSTWADLTLSASSASSPRSLLQENTFVAVGMSVEAYPISCRLGTSNSSLSISTGAAKSAAVGRAGGWLSDLPQRIEQVTKLA